jgi:DNA-binding MarR family transcriptional regulator
VGLSDSALSKQLSTLERAGYLQIRKSFVGKRPRTSARLTRAGRTAFMRHVAALQQIVERSGVTVLPGPPGTPGVSERAATGLNRA